MEWRTNTACVKKWLVALLLLSSLLQASSQQTYPYVAFGGTPVPNHWFLSMSQLQDSAAGRGTLVCHTDLDRVNRGNWYFPNGSVVLSSDWSNGIFASHGNQTIELKRGQGDSGPSGMYHCRFPSTAAGEAVYVGIYSRGGDASVSGIHMRVRSDPDGPSPQFTLTCISTGGPATTVTWTRDSATVTQGTETVLARPERAIYLHTLTGSTNGEYTCTVANNKPSIDSATYSIPGPSPPTNVTAVREGPTNVTVSWSPYRDTQILTRIEWQCTASESGFLGSIRTTYSHRLTGFRNGETCNISVSSTLEEQFPSDGVRLSVSLVPGAPRRLSVGRKYTTAINLLWRAPFGSVVTGYEVKWKTNASKKCPYLADKGTLTITDPSVTNYEEIVGLAAGTTYIVTVSTFNDAGSSVGTTINAITEEAAPSAATPSVRISVTSFTTIIVQWGVVECNHTNGEITGYSVRYGEVGDRERSVERVGAGERELTLSRLSPAVYTIEVAAVNNAGIGVYSTWLRAKTEALRIVVNSSSTTHLVISWLLNEGLNASSYNISYSNTHCFTPYYEDITTRQMVVNLTGLEEGTEYSITVTATLSGHNLTEKRNITASTMPTAPTAAPMSVRPSRVTFSDITLTWGTMPCLEENGIITGYSVRYMTIESTHSVSFSTGNITEATISGLSPSTVYSVQVAGINTAGTGEYGDPLILTTRNSVYLSLEGNFVPNHGYLSVEDIGSSHSTALLCHTNRQPRYSSNSGGDWFTPNRVRINGGNAPGFTRNRGPMVVRLRASAGPADEGIYCCIATDRDSVEWRMCAGIYNNSGALFISENISLTVIPDLNGPSPQFNLTCISTGGPATTVTWTRDSTTVTQGTETVLIDPVTAQYTHTLTVSGRPEGLYTCTVSNSKPSQDSAQLNVNASNPFEEFSLVDSSATSLTFSWTLTPVASLLITGYSITCTPLMEGIPLPEPLVGEQKDTSATVTGLHPGISYTCVAVTFSPWQISPPQNITYSTSEIVPSGSPEAFEAVVGQRQVVFTWSPPPVTQRNGVITSYTLSCSPSPSSLPQSPSSQSRSLTATGFSPNTLYSCSLAANNSQGSGPPSIRNFTTLEDYSYFQLHLRGVASCPEYTLSLTNEKLDDITGAVLAELRDACRNCAITSSTIDEEYFACDSESPTYVTYRARLEGTSETDSGSLIPLIEKWFSRKSSIVVARIEISIDLECPVAVLSPNDTEGCKSPTVASQSVLDDSGAVIGGAVAIILIIALTIVAVSIARLRIAAHHRREPSNAVWRAEQVVMTDLPDGKDISTYSNAAYDVVKFRTGRREEVGEEDTGGSSGDDGHYATICQSPYDHPNPSPPATPQEYENPVNDSGVGGNPPDDSTSNNPQTAPEPGYVNVSGEAQASAVQEVVYAQAK